MSALELHPTYRGRRFTLRGLYRDAEAAARKADALESAGRVVFAFSAVAPSGRTLVFVAAQHATEPARRAALPHRHTADWEATRMAIEAFRETLRAARRRGRTTRWYKGLDVDALHGCVRAFAWSGRRLDVAAGILSSTILVHPFPNANHRTALALARMYLASAGVRWPPYDLRGRGTERLFRETHAFYRDSKYLLQLLRHRDLVRVAHEEGFTHLHIGVDTDAPIRAPDLDLDSAEFRRRHQDLSSRTIEAIAGGEGMRALRAENTLGLSDWVRWYRA